MECAHRQNVELTSKNSPKLKQYYFHAEFLEEIRYYSGITLIWIPLGPIFGGKTNGSVLSQKLLIQRGCGLLLKAMSSYVTKFGKALRMGFFQKIEFDARLISSIHRANPHSSLRPIARLVVKIQRFACNRATPPIIEKLRSKGVAIHLYGVSRKSIK